MFWILGFFALCIGLLLGLFGGGGSIMAVPVLVHVAELPGKEAIAMSLLVVGATSSVGFLRHAKAGNVDWGAGVIFAPFAMLGAFGGGLGAKYIPEEVLLGLFALMMLVTAIAMLRGKKKPPETEGDAEAEPKRAKLWVIALEGLAIGGFTGLVGAGGGFLVVPTLMLLGGLPMHRAVGTSLLVIATKSFTGFLGYISHVEVNYTLGFFMVAVAVVGTLIGAQFATKISATKLRQGFAYFVLAMGVFMILEPTGISPILLGAIVVAVLASAFGIQHARSTTGAS